MQATEPSRDWHADPYAIEYPESTPFWEAAEAGTLLLPQCTQCGRCHWHPRAFCPLCGAADPQWRSASGQGEVFSYSIARTEDPYVVAYVKLNEGPLMLTNIVDCDPGSVRIGQSVTARFRRTPQGRLLPVFVPAPCVKA